MEVNLFSAIKLSDSKEVREILLKNPRLIHNCLDERGASPLWRAMLEDHNEIVDLLIRDFGADPDEESLMSNQYCQEKTFLQYVAAADCDDDDLTLKRFNTAKTLIKHGANTSLIKNKFDSPLMIAISSGNLLFVEFLLNYGTNLPAEPIECYQLFPNIFENYEKPEKDRKKMLELLLKYGFNIEFIDDDGQNILHLFIHSFVNMNDVDSVEIAEILIERAKISPDDPDKNNWSPLIYAIEEEHLPLVTFFIEKGADVNRQSIDDEGKFPIHNAVELTNVDITKLLLSNGANLNAKSKDGSTALHFACNDYNNEEMISFLIRRGADISAEDNRGKTSFAVAFVNDTIDNCCVIIIKKFSMLSFENIPVNAKDTNLIQANPTAREHFEACLHELRLMANTIFYPPFSYYSVLKMSRNNMKKLALLTKNEELLTKFKANLNSFTYFQDDLQIILEESVEIKDRLVAVESRLKYIFGNFFPDIILRILAENLNLKNLPLE